MEREQLENRIKELTVLIEESSNGVKNLVEEQAAFTKRLDDLNKPKLSPAQFDEIHEIIETALDRFELDPDNCEFELELDYDNRVRINHFEWSNIHRDLTQHIMDRMEEIFAVDEDEE
jgi:hypothetical protein